MSAQSSWRSPNFSKQYASHDFLDFAQEFLRRNADYCADHQATLERIEVDPDSRLNEMEGLAGRWGLRFPHCSRIKSQTRTGVVVAGSGSRRRSS